MPRSPRTATTGAAAFWPAHWPVWTSVPVAAGAFAVGALVAVLTGDAGTAPAGGAGTVVADSDVTDRISAPAVPAINTSTAGELPEAAPNRPAVEADPPARPPQRAAAETTAEPQAPAIAPAPQPAAPPARVQPSPPPPREPGATPEPRSDPAPAPDRTPPARPEQPEVRTDAPVAASSPGRPVPAGLRGTFRDPAGPVAGLRVTLMNAQAEVVLETVTDDGGVYELFPVPPGEYTVQFLRNGDIVYERPALPFGEGHMRTLGVSSPVPVSPGPLAPGTDGR